MKKNKRYLSLILAIIMVLTVVPFSYFQVGALEIPVVSLKSSSDTAAVGDVITLTIETTQNSKIVSFGGTITIDTEYFEILPDSKSFADGTVGEINTATAGKVRIAFASGQPLDDSITELFSVDFRVLKINGTLDLEVNETYIADGNADKKVTSEVDANVQPLTITCKHGYTLTGSTDATCTTDGVKELMCSACGDEYTETISATGHSIVNVDAKAPTCTETGYEAYEYCSVCDYTTFKETSATGHSYTSAVTAPTCTQQGYTTYTCLCEDSYVDDYVNALGHEFKDGVCTVCDAPDPDSFTFEIDTPSTTKISCRNGIILHAKIEGNIPEGATIKWTASNQNFTLEDSGDGKSVTIISKNNGNSIITATVYDVEGKIIVSDTIEMRSDAGLLQKIFGFFRVIFGMNKILEK